MSRDVKDKRDTIHKLKYLSPCGISSTAIHFCVVFSRESTTSVCSPASVGVDDDLATSKSCITHWSTDDKVTTGVDVKLCVLVKVLGRNCLLYNLLGDLLAENFQADLYKKCLSNKHTANSVQ